MIAFRIPQKSFQVLATLLLGAQIVNAQSREDSASRPNIVEQFVQQHCVDCHQGTNAEAGLDFDSLPFDLSKPSVFQRWVLIHDRIRDGEMPPTDGTRVSVLPTGASIDWEPGSLDDGSDDFSVLEARKMLHALATELGEQERKRIRQQGRATVRRMNRLEYENTLRRILNAPWLQIAHQLPADGIAHLFNKVGDRLDVSHVQMAQYLNTARHAIQLAMDAAAHPSEKRKFYAREQPTMQRYVHYRFGQRAATRSIVPLLGLTTEPDVIRKLQPMTVGDSNPVKRELEAMGVFSGVYSATTKYDFARIDAPIDGQYRLRFKTFTFMAGPNGADGGDDHGLTGGKKAWWRPDRNVASVGLRSEPVTLYALSSGGDSRWLTTFDSYPEPTVFECVVTLRKGEGIRPDAARLVRTRPGWKGNPNATQEGVPGFAMNWLEIEGPLNDQWPPASYQALFGDLPLSVSDGNVTVVPRSPYDDAERLLTTFLERVHGRDIQDVQPYLDLFERAIALGEAWTDAMISTMSAILSSPKFLYFDTKPGTLTEFHLKKRLEYFLFNGPAGPHESTTRLTGSDATSMKQVVERMLNDHRCERFVNAFLDYWLDLRDINANTPDSELYPDYYLDELLTESSVIETRLFFRELIRRDLPVTDLIDSDFTFVNERLAQHYGLPAVEGVRLQYVDLPEDSPRGGLLTQASVLRITANGTTTSPVTRGVWIVERILGEEIPSPPSGVAAVEPDIRGAKTIREQLEKHRADKSCSTCHARIDPAGFALESFDVAGGWRSRYRSVGDAGNPVAGIGKNGHIFKFKLAQPVDCRGTLADGRAFADINELKRILVGDERQLARNFTNRLVVYATGATIGFSDRAEIERILDRAQSAKYGVRTLIHQIVQSKLFREK